MRKLILDTNTYDCRLRHPFRTVLAGGSCSGKTTWAMQLLANAKNLIDRPQCTQNVIVFTREKQKILENAMLNNLVHEVIQEYPTISLIRALVEPYKNIGGSLILLDDLAGELANDKEISSLFTVLSHHLQISVIMTTQNLFLKNLRTISLNASHILLFKNPRDNSQVANLARQIWPQNPRFVIDSYANATSAPYSYMLFDLTQATPDQIRFRSDIFNKFGPVIYTQR